MPKISMAEISRSDRYQDLRSTLWLICSSWRRWGGTQPKVSCSHSKVVTWIREHSSSSLIWSWILTEALWRTLPTNTDIVLQPWHRPRMVGWAVCSARQSGRPLKTLYKTLTRPPSATRDFFLTNKVWSARRRLGRRIQWSPRWL